MKYAEAWEDLRDNLLEMMDAGYNVSPLAVVELMNELEEEYE